MLFLISISRFMALVWPLTKLKPNDINLIYCWTEVDWACPNSKLFWDSFSFCIVLFLPGASRAAGRIGAAGADAAARSPGEAVLVPAHLGASVIGRAACTNNKTRRIRSSAVTQSKWDSLSHFRFMHLLSSSFVLFHRPCGYNDRNRKICLFCFIERLNLIDCFNFFCFLIGQVKIGKLHHKQWMQDIVYYSFNSKTIKSNSTRLILAKRPRR